MDQPKKVGCFAISCYRHKAGRQPLGRAVAPALRVPLRIPRLDAIRTIGLGNPETSLPKLFPYVGYNQRTTAVRNFQKITGVTPAEFIESTKQ